MKEIPMPVAVKGPLMTDAEITETIAAMSSTLTSAMAEPVAAYLFGCNYGRPIDDTLVRRAYMFAFTLLGALVPESYLERVDAPGDGVDQSDVWEYLRPPL